MTSEMLDTHQSSDASIVSKQTSTLTAAPSSELPSPDETGIGGPDALVHRSCASAPLNPHFTSFLESSISQPFPLPTSSLHSLPTPVREEDRQHLSLSFAGSALPSTNVSLPTPTIVKTQRNFRLPDFDAVAVPHPDRIALRSATSFSSLGAGPLSKPEDPLHALSPPLAHAQPFSEVGEPAIASPDSARAQVELLVPVVTPPTEPGSINWGSFVNIKTAGLGSPPSSDPGLSPSIHVTASATPPAPAAPATDALSVSELSDALGMATWLERVKDIITSNTQAVHSDSIKVLSHALPCPSVTGHLFGHLIAAIHERSPTPTAWVNVFHAVPGRYTLSELPKSPPSTPGNVVGGDEYFTSKVFDSAVAVPDYQLDSKLLPPSPRPVVAPGSVNISIVERYIPPTNSNEFTEMFRVRGGRSLLYDRVVELSSDNGLLLFIYPTKTGARTFANDYLSPILDPLLRTITVVHDLSSDLGRSLSQMAAVEHLSEYEPLKAHLENFLEKLSERNASPSASGEQKPTYSIIHAAKEEVVLDREVWANDWWVKQEKPRVRELVTKFFRKKLPSSELTPTNLIQEVLDGVAHREHHPITGPRGIEVGVFIVKKSA